MRPRVTRGVHALARHTRRGVIAGTPYGSAYRYNSRYALPFQYDASGTLVGQLTIDPVVGYATGQVFPTAVVTPALTVSLTDQGSAVANANLLNATLQTYKDDTRNIRIAVPKIDYGRHIVYPSPRVLGCGWIEITDANPVRAEGVRVQKSDASNMPSLTVNWQDHATDPNTTTQSSCAILPLASRKIRLTGFNVTFAPSFTPVWAYDDPTLNGTDNNHGFFDAAVPQGAAQSDPTAYPSWLIIDRCLFHGTLGKALYRLVYFNVFFGAILDSQMYDVGHWPGSDSQCVFCGTAGPYLFRNNAFEMGAGGEGLLFGGTHLTDFSWSVTDAQVIHNYFTEPPSWKALNSRLQVKNLFETKTGVRVLVERNVFDHFQGGYNGQGSAINLKANYNNSMCQDVTVRCNVFLDCDQPIKFTDANMWTSSMPCINRLDIHQNIAYRPSTTASNSLGVVDAVVSFFQGGDLTLQTRDIAYHHNTFFVQPAHFPLFFDENSTNHDMAGWHVHGNAWSWYPLGQPERYFRTRLSTSALAYANWFAGQTDGRNWDHNVTTGTYTFAGKGAPTDLLRADDAAMGLNPDGTLTVGAFNATADSDGGMVGANGPLVLLLVTGVDTGL